MAQEPLGHDLVKRDTLGQGLPSWLNLVVCVDMGPSRVSEVYETFTGAGIYIIYNTKSSNQLTK